MDIPETGVMRVRVPYDQHGAALMALCVPVDEQCEDVVQETLLRASQRTLRRTLQEMGGEQ
jgi:hypothetical protein